MSVRVRQTFGDPGFLVRESVLGEDEVARLRTVAEDVAARVAAHARREGAGPEGRLADGARIQFSSRTAIQWEWAEGSNEIRMLEPCEHLDPAFADLFLDERLVGPAREALGLDDVAPFTSKLNLKRAREGSELPWHQGYPYWYPACEEDAADLLTAVVFLDDADAGNGALRVLPGSHLLGPARRDRDEPTQFLADPAALDTSAEVVVEVPAGSVMWFGSFLVHRSSPNTSSRHRRALLFTWQPPGRPRLFATGYRPHLVEQLP